MCFLIDCTGSMEPWIQAAKEQAQDMIQATRREQPDAEFQTAFVGYRDYGDEERFIVVDFTEPDNMLARVRDVHADGGCDAAEDVAGGLDRVWELNWWDADVRMVVHIADAPPHGRNYHPVALGDRFPEGDPEHRDPLIYIEKFVDRGIDYTFVKIDDTTDMMIGKFACVWGERPGFRVLDLRPQVVARQQQLPPPVSPPLHAPALFETPRRTIVADDPTLYLSPGLSRMVSDSITRHTSSQVPGGF